MPILYEEITSYLTAISIIVAPPSMQLETIVLLPGQPIPVWPLSANNSQNTIAASVDIGPAEFNRINTLAAVVTLNIVHWSIRYVVDFANDPKIALNVMSYMDLYGMSPIIFQPGDQCHYTSLKILSGEIIKFGQGTKASGQQDGYAIFTIP